VGSKGKRLEEDVRARGRLAGERETALYGVAAPGYEEFAKTGGISPEEKEMTRRRTASGISSMFGRLKSALQRRGRVQGGYAPGMGAQEAKLGRQAAAAQGEALTGTDLALLQEQRAGRLAGLGGTAGLMQGYQGEQAPLFGVRTELEKKRRGVLGTIGAGLDIGGQVGKMALGFK